MIIRLLDIGIFLSMRMPGQKIILKPLYHDCLLSTLLAEKMLEFTLLKMPQALGKLILIA